MSIKWEPTPKGNRPSTLRPYTGDIEPLSYEDVAYFGQRYTLDREFLERTGYIKVDTFSSRYVLPIFAPEGYIRGHVLREPWPNAPRKRSYIGPKADTFMAKHEPVQSFYMAYNTLSDVLIAVEDQLSAIKLSAAGYDAVAMLGTPWSKDLNGYQGADRVSEIAHVVGNKELIVALDADATEASFEFARKWRYAFKKLRVAILTKDLKDTPMSEFGETLGV